MSGRIEALVLLGPTGAGKSPLGAELERRGLGGRRCLHFDFGARLRAVAAGGNVARKPGNGEPVSSRLTRSERAVVGRVLAAGALLDDDEFPIALKILREFLADRCARAADIIVLNGLPRHVGQAERLDRIVKVSAVATLECPERTVLARIRGNAGGDRIGRRDDGDIAAIRRRMAVYEERTRPLIAYYERRDAGVIRLPVGPDTTAADMADRLEAEAGGRFPARPAN